MNKFYITFFKIGKFPLITLGVKHLKYIALFFIFTLTCKLYLTSMPVILYVYIAATLYILNILDELKIINIFNSYNKALYDILMISVVSSAIAIIWFGVERNDFNLVFGCRIFFVFSLFVFVPILQYTDKRVKIFNLL